MHQTPVATNAANVANVCVAPDCNRPSFKGRAGESSGSTFAGKGSAVLCSFPWVSSPHMSEVLWQDLPPEVFAASAVRAIERLFEHQGLVADPKFLS